MYRTVENLRNALAQQLLINEQLLSDKCELNSRVNNLSKSNMSLKSELSDAEWKIKKLEEIQFLTHKITPPTLLISIEDKGMSNFLERYGQNEQEPKSSILG